MTVANCTFLLYTFYIVHVKSLEEEDILGHWIKPCLMGKDKNAFFHKSRSYSENLFPLKDWGRAKCNQWWNFASSGDASHFASSGDAGDFASRGDASFRIKPFFLAISLRAGSHPCHDGFGRHHCNGVQFYHRLGLKASHGKCFSLLIIPTKSSPYHSPAKNERAIHSWAAPFV